MNLLDLIRECEENTAAHTSDCTLSALWQFLQGFLYCKTSVESGEEDLLLIDHFNSWLGREYKLNMRVSACRILLFHSSSESEALGHFFEAWKKFLTHSGENIQERTHPVQPQRCPRNPSELIDHIQLRPGMYLGSLVFKDFVHFLGGYRHCLKVMELPQTDKRFERFQHWIQTRRQLNRPWHKILELFSSEPSRLLEEFFELWKDFKNVDHLLSEIEQNPQDSELYKKAVDVCCEAQRPEGIVLISNLIKNFHPGNDEEKELRIKKGLLMETFGDTSGARSEITKALTLHHKASEKKEPSWSATSRSIHSILERL